MSKWKNGEAHAMIADVLEYREPFAVHHGDCKKCGRCGVLKSRSDFHKRQRSKDGLQSYCKVCDRDTSVRQRNTEKRKEYAKQWVASESGKASNRTYLSSATGMEARRRRAKKHRQKNPLKAAARLAVRRAVESGLLIRPNDCSRCGRAPPYRRDGRSGIQAHHADYSRTLDVVWMCITCHRETEESSCG